MRSQPLIFSSIQISKTLFILSSIVGAVLFFATAYPGLLLAFLTSNAQAAIVPALGLATGVLLPVAVGLCFVWGLLSFIADRMFALGFTAYITEDMNTPNPAKTTGGNRPTTEYFFCSITVGPQ